MSRWITLVCVATVLLATGFALAAGSIDSSDKYAWPEVAGWQNWNPMHGGVTVHGNGASSHLSGYARCENTGWVHFKNTSPAYNVKTTVFDTPPPAGTQGTVFRFR